MDCFVRQGYRTWLGRENTWQPPQSQAVEAREDFAHEDPAFFGFSKHHNPEADPGLAAC